MAYAILFVMAFLLGAVLYWTSGRWWLGVSAAMVMYIFDVLTDEAAREVWVISLIFGLPIVFAAALLGAYVLERARYEPDEAAESELSETEDETGDER